MNNSNLISSPDWTFIGSKGEGYDFIGDGMWDSQVGVWD